jgi:hypothetical protein
MPTKIAIALLIAGVILLTVGLSLPRYHDGKKYEQQRSTLESSPRDRPTLDHDFQELRRSSLTPSLKLEDYGLTTISVGVLTLAGVHWRRTAAFLPKRRITVALLGGFAAVATIAAYVGSLLLDFDRGEFPAWGDSLAVPLIGVPLMLIALLVWAGLHSLLVKNSAGSWRLTLRNENWWLALLVSITMFVLVACSVLGDFWNVWAAAVWVIFYFSIWISRSAEEPNHPTEPTSTAIMPAAGQPARQP